MKTYEQWLAEQNWPGHEELPQTLDEVDRLGMSVAHHSDEGSLAETLSVALDGLLIEIRSRRADDLTAEDIDTLTYLRFFAEEAFEAGAVLKGLEPQLVQMAQRAIVLLERLTAVRK